MKLTFSGGQTRVVLKAGPTVPTEREGSAPGHLPSHPQLTPRPEEPVVF